jgi:hypothetical protein
MSRRTEHIEDVITNQAEVPPEDFDEETEEDTEEDDLFTPNENWQSWHQDHLLNMYFSLKEYCQDTGLDFMRYVSFAQFCDFLYSTNRSRDQSWRRENFQGI